MMTAKQRFCVKIRWTMIFLYFIVVPTRLRPISIQSSLLKVFLDSEL
ncbi:hypothetical protein LEP1GSC082_0799 [Leptospira kirschneri str. H2]|nr:hypothetical protein LEP1GSC082_0799 [Leptospira kirschneri str. H2]